MMKLWQHGKPGAASQKAIDLAVEKFTVGKDPLLDLALLPYDCLASKAHARMLADIGLLSRDEAAALTAGLDEILALHARGEFTIAQSDEDGHTAIENHLVRRCGEAGKKIHTGRSRNDQVLTALRLYSKEQAGQAIALLQKIVATFDILIAARGELPLPGYTHTRKAMPSNVGMWAAAFREALQDDLRLLDAAVLLIDQNPLGTGAGYGIPLPLDRQKTTEALGFARVMANPIHAQNSRGKYEGILLHGLAQVMADINRMASDLVLFTMPGFGFFTLPAAFMTGSSIMPQKQNPDVLELLRAKYHAVAACEFQVRSSTINLISGYHRDLQLTKEPLMRGLATALESLQMTLMVVQNLGVDEARCKSAMTEELYATERAYQLVQQGVPFREAYRIVAAQYHEENAHGKR
jgi:argininosuccinate lyase